MTRSPQVSARRATHQFAAHDRLDDAEAAGAVVQAGDAGEFLAAAVVEVFGVLAADLLDRLEAVGREARRHHGEPFHAAGGEGLDGLVGVGLQPFRAAEARLERQLELVGGEAEPFPDQPRRLGALAMVGITLEQVFLRHAVERRDDDLGLEVEL